MPNWCIAMSASKRSARRLRLGIIGWGAIASRVAQLLAERQRDDIEIAVVAVRDTARDRGLPSNARVISHPDELSDLDLDMIIEAAGRPAVEVWGMAALRHARRFAVSSTSAFTDEALLDRLLATARETGSRIVVPSGALGDLGMLAAASILPLDEVTHSIVKPPRAWRSTKAEEFVDLDALAARTEFFAGTAREAAAAFPQNANVAVITALSGIGLDRTRVVLVADPSILRNVHEIRASGAFGKLELKLENEPLAANPKSSEMTALSLVRLIENSVAALVV